MTFAFIILGDFDAAKDRAVIRDGAARIIGVANLEEACAAARELQSLGVGCIELCGAFGEEGAWAVIRATQNKLPVGFVTHLPEQEELYRAAFGHAE